MTKKSISEDIRNVLNVLNEITESKIDNTPMYFNGYEKLHDSGVRYDWYYAFKDAYHKGQGNIYKHFIVDRMINKIVGTFDRYLDCEKSYKNMEWQSRFNPTEADTLYQKQEKLKADKIQTTAQNNVVDDDEDDREKYKKLHQQMKKRVTQWNKGSGGMYGANLKNGASSAMSKLSSDAASLERKIRKRGYNFN